MYQLFAGLAEIHRKRIIHRDIKPQNILVTGGQLCICDFGLARIRSEPSRPYSPLVDDVSRQVCTQYYRPPEVMLNLKNYSYEVDVWSAGCVFLELIMKVPYLKGDSDYSMLYQVFKLLGTPNTDDWPEFGNTTVQLKNFSFFEKEPLSEKLAHLELDGDQIDLLEVGCPVTLETVRAEPGQALLVQNGSPPCKPGPNDQPYFDEIRNQMDVEMNDQPARCFDSELQL
jgi:cyclin-dependent kinase